jgi:hypothetical protein
MTHDYKTISHLFWIAVYAAILMWLFVSTGCSGVNCNRPELSAELRGVVLECNNTKSARGNKYVSCLVMKADGTTVNIIYQGCPVASKE